MFINKTRILENFNEGVRLPVEDNESFDTLSPLLMEFLQEDYREYDIAFELGILSRLDVLSDIICVVLCSRYNFIIPIIQKEI